MDLKNKTRKELLEMKAEIEKRLSKIEKEERKKALSDIQELARSRGFSLDELVVQKSKAPRAKAPVKYRHPETGQEWSGRGRRPAWIATENDLSKFEV